MSTNSGSRPLTSTIREDTYNLSKIKLNYTLNNP